MKAAVYHGPQNITIQEVPRPEPGPGEVLLRIKHVGICGTDLHIFSGGTSVQPGIIIGHEFSGQIEQLGQGVTQYKVGDRVVAEHVLTCGQCYYCLRGKPELCDQAQIYGIDRAGALAEHMVVPEKLVYVIPDTISFEEAALIEPLTIALFAAAQARSLAGQKVAVVGQGPIGILLDQVLKSAGATVIGIDTQSARRDFAQQHGWIDYALDPTNSSFHETLQSIVPLGVDTAFEVVGKEATAELCLEIARRDADIFLLGVFEHPAKLDLMKIVRKELHVHGSWTCAFSFPAAISLVAEKKVDLQSLITHRPSLDEAPEVFQAASQYSDNRIKTVFSI